MTTQELKKLNEQIVSDAVRGGNENEKIVQEYKKHVAYWNREHSPTGRIVMM